MTFAYRTPILTASVTLNGLGASSSLTVGQASAAINPTNNDDYASPVLRVVTSTTAPTAGGQIELWAFKRMPDGNWPDLFTVPYAGADVARTVVSRDVLVAGAKLIGSVTNNATPSQPYTIDGRELGLAFGVVPEEFAFFITQSTGQALGASGHSLTIQQANQT